MCIGLSDDEVTEGTWIWSHSNEIATYFSWDSGQPDGGESQDWVYLSHNYNYNWYDYEADHHFYPLCHFFPK